MDNQELMRYLKDAIELETSIVEQEHMIAEYTKLSMMRKPERHIVKYPTAPSAKEFKLDSTKGFFIGFMFFAILIVLLFAFTSLHRDSSSAIISLAFSLLIIAGLAVYIRSIIQDKKKVDEANMRAWQDYERTRRSIAKRNDENATQYQLNLSTWARSNTDMQSFMAAPLAKSRALLERFYASDVIYPKYRTLPALTSIYEYFMTGRCTELTGPHGAYNLYEDELRKDTVISQLNAVIENLEQIRQNQYMLYQKVNAIQENTAVIASELKQIKGYAVQIAQLTALNAYYAALNERNTRITMYYHL